MDWNRINRKSAAPKKPAGAYINLDDLIRIQFKVGDFSFLPQQPVTSVLSGRYASRLRGRGLNFEELRRYQPGDDIRTIDWKVTARTQTPHVRVYTEEKDRAVILIVDQRINMFFGTKEKFKSVTAAELAAVGVWRGTGVGDRVGAIVFNDTEMVEVTPRNSQQNAMTILGTVVRMNHHLTALCENEPDPGMLNRALERARRFAPHDALVVLISDFFGVDKKTERIAAELTQHNDVLALLPFDPIRKKPGHHFLNLGNTTLEMEIDFSKKDNRDKLVADFQAEQDQIKYFLRKLSVPLLMISNEGDVTDQLRKHLGVTPRGC